MRPVLIALLLSLPAVALADDHCTHSAPRQLQLDLAGVKKVRVETRQFGIDLRATAGPGHVLQGRACASKAQWLPDLTLTQERRGDTLVVSLRRENEAGLSSLFGDNYAWMEIAGTVPADVLVQLVVGSGEASLDGAASASADVGSGEATLRGIRGLVTAKVGSGDIDVDGAGSLDVLSVGSGDIKARNVGGNAKVGSIGSGDFGLDNARGDVTVGSIGSGDAELHNIGGAVRIDSIGSGDAEVHGAARLSVGSIGSGGVDHRDVTGAVELPRRD